MRRLPTILLTCAATVAASLAGAGTATAAPSMQNVTCSGSWATGPGTLDSGTYQHVTVQGPCLVPNGANITIRAGLSLAPHSVLLAFFTSQNMSIYGGITIGQGAVLGLGCTPEFGCDGLNGNPPPSQDVVHGGIVTNDALSMYLNGDTIYGDVSFIGGGAGPDCVDHEAANSIGHSLAVKDNTFYGNVTLQGWAGCWIGFLRNTVHGVVTIADDYANQDSSQYIDDPFNFQGADSTEVVANTIWGGLNCYGNTPAAQFGDAILDGPPGYGPNTVHGSVTGECLALLA